MLLFWPSKWLFRAAAAICIIEVVSSGILLLGCLFASFDPIVVYITIGGVRWICLSSLGAQLAYVATRSALFIASAIVLTISGATPNQALQLTATPTAFSLHPPAAEIFPVAPANGHPYRVYFL